MECVCSSCDATESRYVKPYAGNANPSLAFQLLLIIKSEKNHVTDSFVLKVLGVFETPTLGFQECCCHKSWNLPEKVVISSWLKQECAQ